MPDICFTAHYGEQTKHVTLSRPYGNAGIYHIMIDHYYCGQIVFQAGEWRYYPNNSEISGDDLQVLIDMITSYPAP